VLNRSEHGWSEQYIDEVQAKRLQEMRFLDEAKAMAAGVPVKEKVYHRKVTRVPDIQGAVQPLQNQNTMRNRLGKDSKRWKEVRRYVKDRKEDLMTLDGYERDAARDHAWIEASFLFPPPPSAKGVKWPDLAVKEELRRREKKTQAVRQEVVNAAPVELESSVPKSYENDPSQFGTAWDGEVLSKSDAEQFVRDIAWAYHRIGTPISKAKSPSPGAYELALWARENRDAFYKQTVLSALRAQENLEKIKQDGATQREAMRLKAKEEERAANVMTKEEMEEMAATLDLCHEFGLSFDEVNQGIKAPWKEVTEKLGKDFPEVKEAVDGCRDAGGLPTEECVGESG
jgi:hypothetical protein